MRFVTGLAAGLAVVAMTSAGSAQESGPASKPADPALLIRQLDSDDFGTRESATQELIRLGPAARGPLLEARGSGSLERRARIEQILGGMLAQTSSRPIRRDATRVTLRADNKPLAEICAFLSKETGYPIRGVAGSTHPVSLSVTDRPLFEVLDLISAQAGCRIVWDPNQRGFSIETTGEKQGPVAYSGPLRATLLMLTTSRTTRFAGGASSASANLQLRIDAEDRSQALGIMIPPKVKDFVDDQNRSLRVPEQFQSYTTRFDARRQLQTFIQMGGPEPDAKAIKRLEFNLPLLLPTAFYEAELNNPEEGMRAGDGDFSVTVESWGENAGNREVRLSILRPQLSTPGPPVIAVADDLITFVGPEGAPIQPLNFNFAAQRVGTLLYFANLPLSATVTTLKVSCLKGFETVEFPIVFENIPLP
jgi:hypothetical protein